MKTGESQQNCRRVKLFLSLSLQVSLYNDSVESREIYRATSPHENLPSTATGGALRPFVAGILTVKKKKEKYENPILQITFGFQKSGSIGANCESLLSVGDKYLCFGDGY